MTAATQLRPQPHTAAQPACWGVDPELFYGPADSPEGRAAFGWEWQALRVCAGCPVQGACLDTALEFPADEQHGVSGGMTAGQRRALLHSSGYHQPSRSSLTVGEQQVRQWRGRHRASLSAKRPRRRALPEGVA